VSHLTGKFRGAAHESCNENYQIQKFFPVIFHKLSGHDSHLFIKKLKGNCEDSGEEASCIAKNEENYITFSKKWLVDSFMKEVFEKDKAAKEVKYKNRSWLKRVAVYRLMQIYACHPR